MTFWDIVAPFYDVFEWLNNAYKGMIHKVYEILPEDSTVLELASGTGSISLAISGKANKVLITDISDNMLKIAKRKAKDKNNIEFAGMNIFETGLADESYDVVVASQVLHLVDEPQKACDEIKRVAKNMVILPMSLTKECTKFGRFLINLYKFFGFKPKQEFNKKSYKEFLEQIGFKNCEFLYAEGTCTMCIPVWRNEKNN